MLANKHEQSTQQRFGVPSWSDLLSRQMLVIGKLMGVCPHKVGEETQTFQWGMNHTHELLHQQIHRLKSNKKNQQTSNRSHLGNKKKLYEDSQIFHFWWASPLGCHEKECHANRLFQYASTPFNTNDNITWTVDLQFLYLGTSADLEIQPQDTTDSTHMQQRQQHPFWWYVRSVHPSDWTERT